MYSVILAAALSMGGDATAWHHHHYHGCYGCWGCHGCHGWYHGHGCWGCYGCSCYGCYGCSCYGCYGSCYGCYGCSCYGCYGCSCYGSVVYSSCYGCSGCWGCYGGVVYSSCYGCAGCVGAVVAAAPAAPAGGSGLTPEEVDLLRKLLRAKAKPAASTNNDLGNVARLTVKLPADAKLFVDHVECPLSTSVRSFTTPALEQGKDYHYTLRVQVRRDGHTLTESRRVGFTAGRRVEVDFTNSETLRTAAR